MDIPDELLLLIIRYLDGYFNITTTCRVCKHFRSIVDTLHVDKQIITNLKLPDFISKSYIKSMTVHFTQLLRDSNYRKTVGISDETFIYKHMKHINIVDVWCKCGSSAWFRDIVHRFILYGIDSNKFDGLQHLTELEKVSEDMDKATNAQLYEIFLCDRPLVYLNMATNIKNEGDLIEEALNASKYIDALKQILIQPIIDVFELIKVCPILIHQANKHVCNSIKIMDWVVSNGYECEIPYCANIHVSNDVAMKYPKVIRQIKNPTIEQMECYEKYTITNHRGRVHDKQRSWYRETSNRFEKSRLGIMIYLANEGIDKRIFELSIGDAIQLIPYSKTFELENRCMYKMLCNMSKKYATAFNEHIQKRSNIVRVLDMSLEDIENAILTAAESWEQIPDKYHDDIRLARLAVKTHPLCYLNIISNVSDRLKDDKEFMIECVKDFGCKVLRHASMRLRVDKQFISAAMDLSEGGAYVFGWLDVRRDKDLAIKAVNTATHVLDVLKFVPPTIKRHVLDLEAVKYVNILKKVGK